MRNKFCTYLSIVEPYKVLFFKPYNTEFDEIFITFTNQNGRPLGVEDKVNLILHINK